MNNEDFELVDYDSPEGKAAYRFLERVQVSLGIILEELHDSGAIPEGKYFRIAFGYSCGFQGHINVVIESGGECLPHVVDRLDTDRLN